MSPSGHLHRRRVREWDNKLTIAMSKGKRWLDAFRDLHKKGSIFFSRFVLRTTKRFDEHRFIYERSLLTPFRALVDDLAPAMLKIDPLLETRPAIGKTLSRIHRDTRFSHDKSLYRSRMWLTFKRSAKNWIDAPAYFLKSAPIPYAMGWVTTAPANLRWICFAIR